MNALIISLYQKNFKNFLIVKDKARKNIESLPIVITSVRIIFNFYRATRKKRLLFIFAFINLFASPSALFSLLLVSIVQDSLFFVISFEICSKITYRVSMHYGSDNAEQSIEYESWYKVLGRSVVVDDVLSLDVRYTYIYIYTENF